MVAAHDVSANLMGPSIPDSGSTTELSILGDVPAGMDGNVMARFEALSKAFKSEVECLVGKEKATAQAGFGELHERNASLQEALDAERVDASAIATSLLGYVAEHQADQLVTVFGSEELPGQLDVNAKELRPLVDAFLAVHAGAVRPELEAAHRQTRELQTSLDAALSEIARLREELMEARVLKTQEERDLAEFQALRQKESELQESRMETQHLQVQLEELRTQERQWHTKSMQHEALLRGKSDKIIELVRKLEEQGEKVRLLSDENNTLRLQLGKDLDYIKVVPAPTDPLSYRCRAGVLSEDLLCEERRLREDLRAMHSKFPGLPSDNGNCLKWCDVQLARVSDVHRSFLHRLQDRMAHFPVDLKVEFVSKTQEAGSEWSQQEEHMKDADASFQDSEREHSRRWEEHRLKITSERDTKVRQLLEQAERSQGKSEKQLLLHQAKLYGQRMDTQIERAWEEQRKERDTRWTEHQHRKQEARQKLKDESLAVAKRADDAASASTRFQDMAESRLAAVEDAWLRNIEKEVAISNSALKHGDLAGCFHSSCGDGVARLPAEGASHTGLALLSDTIEELLKGRVDTRQNLRLDLEDQSRQQIRACVEKFIQKEATQQKAVHGDDDERVSHAQAPAITSLLQMRQHRHLSDTLRRQHHDFLLSLRLSSLGAIHLMPKEAAEAYRTTFKSPDLPPLPPELAAAGGEQISPDHAVRADTDDTVVEGAFLYNSLCQRILERVLTVINQVHRDELLDLKRAYAVETRLAVQTFCQLEAEEVEKAVSQDIAEYKLQIASRLLADTEYHVCEERKQMMEQVDSEVADHMRAYKRQVDEQEQGLAKDRRKWLTDRLVILQANGSTGAGDRALLQRLRRELRAVESRIEMLENEYVAKEQEKAATPGGRISPMRRSRSPVSRKQQLLPQRDREVPAQATKQVEPPPQVTNEAHQLCHVEAHHQPAPQQQPSAPCHQPQKQLSQEMTQKELEMQIEMQKREMLHQHVQQTGLASLCHDPWEQSWPLASRDTFTPPGAGGAPLPQPFSSQSPGAHSGSLPPRAPGSPRLPLPHFGMGRSPEAPRLHTSRPLYDWPFEGPTPPETPGVRSVSAPRLKAPESLRPVHAPRRDSSCGPASRSTRGVADLHLGSGPVSHLPVKQVRSRTPQSLPPISRAPRG